MKTTKIAPFSLCQVYKTLTDNLNAREQYLRSRWAESHQCQVGHSVAPDTHLQDIWLVLGCIGEVHLQRKGECDARGEGGG